MASVYKRSGGKYYYIEWQDETGRRKTKSSRTTDKRAAERIAKKLEADAALRREGVIDPTAERIANEVQRPITHHLQTYIDHKKAAGKSPQHIKETESIIKSVCECCGFTIVQDIDSDAVGSYAAGLVEQGRSNRTVQKHVRAIAGFCRWLVRSRKISSNPLDCVEVPNPQNDRRYERREFTESEFQQLVKTTLSDGRTFRTMSAVERPSDSVV